jgi:hypothetical protein
MRHIGSSALSLVCVVALGWPHAVRTTLYRSIYPVVSLDRSTLAAPPDALGSLGYTVDPTAELTRFRDAAAPLVAGIDDDAVRLRTLADFIYSYHPSRDPSPRIPGGRERGVHAIFDEIQSGKFALCGQKTMVLAALWRSIGGDVRQIRFSPGDEVAWYAAHYGIEVYSDRLSKWFYYDATLNGYAANSSGEPMSLVELTDHLVSGENITMVSNRELYDWDAAQFLGALRTNRMQVYSFDNRLRGQDPDRRFGALNFGYNVFSKLPKPFDRVIDAVTGDAEKRFVARPEGQGSAVPMQISASQISLEPSQSDPPPAARAGRGRHRRNF